MHFKGTAHRYGRDIDTDVIIPARYLNSSDPEWLAAHCLEDLDKDFVKKVQKGDIIGHTGATGMAGGDHLHFGILISGVEVTPIEWLDAHWIRDNVSDRILAAGGKAPKIVLSTPPPAAPPAKKQQPPRRSGGQKRR